jgi:hypothetical protein
MDILASEYWKEYELIDSGGLEKLERFGEFILFRPEPQAVWEKSLSLIEWESLSHATYKRARGIDPARSDYSEKGEWIRKPGMKDQWSINYSCKEMNLTFRLGLTSFGHIGVFPEQAVNWEYIYEFIKLTGSLSPFAFRLSPGYITHKRTTNSEQRTANSEQRTANSEQRIANSEQRTANSEQQTANSEQRTAMVKVTLWGTGSVHREFLHVDDMARACIYVMKNVAAKKLYEELNVSQINIGTGQDTTIKEIAGVIKEIVGFKGELAWDASKPNGTYKKQLDVSLLNSLGWKESIPLTSGIEQVYKNYRECQ